jgi:hypothetical protein
VALPGPGDGQPHWYCYGFDADFGPYADLGITVLSAAEDADEGGVDNADEEVLKSPGQRGSSGAFGRGGVVVVGVVAWGYSSRISLTAALAAGSSTRDLPVA